MKAQLIKIEDNNQILITKKGTYDGNKLKCHFDLEDSSYAWTYIVPSFKNWNRWEPVIQSGSGTVVEGLELKKGTNIIDADSFVKVINKVESRIFKK